MNGLENRVQEKEKEDTENVVNGLENRVQKKEKEDTENVVNSPDLGLWPSIPATEHQEVIFIRLMFKAPVLIKS